MSEQERQILGKLERDCDEHKTEIKLDEFGNIIAFKCYGKAKEFRR